MSSPKVLFFDIETAPNHSWVWAKYQQDVIENTSDWYILCFAAKWAHEKRVITSALPDFENYDKDREDDIGVVQELHALLDEADIVIAHNGDRFDIKKTNTRCLIHGLPPPSPYHSIDTLKEVRKQFRFDSNRLDDLGEQLNFGRKVSTGGFALWRGCMQGDSKAWAKMVKYNRQDVLLLERFYEKIRPWMKTHPNLNVYSGNEGCPNCGGRVKKDGTRTTRAGKYQQYKCVECASWHKGEFIKGTRAVIK